jgi:hypothetical protein
MIIEGALLRRLLPVRLAVLLLAVLAQPGRPLAAGEAKPFTFLYVSLAGDADYAESKSYTGLILRDREPPIDGAQAAIRESRIIGRSIGVTGPPSRPSCWTCHLRRFALSLSDFPKQTMSSSSTSAIATTPSGKRNARHHCFTRCRHIAC